MAISVQFWLINCKAAIAIDNYDQKHSNLDQHLSLPYGRKILYMVL